MEEVATSSHVALRRQLYRVDFRPAHRGGRVEQLWPITARGAVY
jgi:hypothetical protein